MSNNLKNYLQVFVLDDSFVQDYFWMSNIYVTNREFGRVRNYLIAFFFYFVTLDKVLHGLNNILGQAKSR